MGSRPEAPATGSRAWPKPPGTAVRRSRSRKRCPTTDHTATEQGFEVCFLASFCNSNFNKCDG